jgi:hypothetical protein
MPMSEGVESDCAGSMTVVSLREFIDAWTAGDVEMLMSFVTDNCVYCASVGPEPGTTYRGGEEVCRGFIDMLAYDRGRERHGAAALLLGKVGSPSGPSRTSSQAGPRRLSGAAAASSSPGQDPEEGCVSQGFSDCSQISRPNRWGRSSI